MKVLISGSFALTFGILLWIGVSIGATVLDCSHTHQDILTSLRTQSNSVNADHARFCSQSYETLNSWDECVAGAAKRAPVQQIAYQMQPMVMNILRSVDDPAGKLQESKVEHDNQCNDQIQTMFYPPIQEK